MKIIITSSTARALATHATQIAAAFNDGDTIDVQHIPQYKLRHHSLTVEHFKRPLGPNAVANDSCYVYEIDDKILLRIAEIYVKLAVFIAPIVAQCIAFAKTLKGDVDEIDRLLGEEHDDAAEREFIESLQPDARKRRH